MEPPRTPEADRASTALGVQSPRRRYNASLPGEKELGIDLGLPREGETASLLPARPFPGNTWAPR